VIPLLIYVAGPYRAPTVWGIDQNIHDARRFGVELAKRRAFPVIPHANTAHFDGLAPDDFWLEGTLALMRKCDGVLLMPTWRASSGARAEAREALNLAMAVVDMEAAPETLTDWLAAIRRCREEHVALEPWAFGRESVEAGLAHFNRARSA